MRHRYAATFSLLPALLTGFVLLLALPGQAAAAKPCWERVIDDWLASPNGTVTGTYKPSCLQQALKNAPEDLRDYTNVADAISAALQDALRGTSGTNPPNSPTDPTGGGSSSNANKDRRIQAVPPPSYYRRAIDNLGTTSSDSLPIPLLVLAGLGALLLLSAGALAANKRLRSNRTKPPAGS